eukprot:TRINITY_DN1082_c0_g1_i1.p1 TRINITY_DN1082_c0_g1~~TRINITY_DN1082_c0_g1_i1.p1  ORF type:complete len:653 (-),score=144.97 TRINITY_DN1082_c0_g1_i1:45-2003(-)
MMSRTGITIALCIFLQILLGCADSVHQHHNCIHDELVQEEIKLGKKRIVQNTQVKRQNGPPLPLRVKIDTGAFDVDLAICRSVGQTVVTDSAGTQYVCQAKDVFTDDKRAFLETELIPGAEAKFAELLNVMRASGPLTLPGNSCGCGGRQAIAIPSNSTYLTSGVDADIVVFMTARPTFNGTVAWACPCMYEGDGRPISGFINWGPNTIDQTPISYPSQFGVGIHEMTHALGFTAGSYNNYKTGPNIVQTVTRTDDGLSHQVNIIGTPKVQQVIRDHFACPTLDGLEIENGGGTGTAGSHWEKRLAANEYMTGTSSSDPVYSYFTMALLEDSGWYYPNYTNAATLYWGKGQGCNFVNLRCATWQRPYNCDPIKGNSDWDCTFDNRKKGVCNLRNLTGNPGGSAWYQNYPNNPNAYGSDSYADYCGFITAQKTWDCTQPENANITFGIEAYGEHYCPTCRCMRTNTRSISVPSCHNFECVGNLLKVQIGDIWYNCDANGKQITITTGYDGYYICPTDSTTQCSGNTVPAPVWPTFVSVTPNSGKPGSSVNITVSNLTDLSQVSFGPQHGCYEPSIVTTVDGSITTISCLIGQLKTAVIVLEQVANVDVNIVDSQGRSATGFKAFTLDTSSGGILNVSWAIVAMAMIGLSLRWE